MSKPRWRYKRAKRLATAPAMIAAYTGESLVRGYMQWFRVHRLVAIEELTMLGVTVPESEIPPKRTPAEKTAAAATRRRRKAGIVEAFHDSDETFAHIVDYTSGGAPFGVTREEAGREKWGPRVRCDPFGEPEVEVPPLPCGPIPTCGNCPWFSGEIVGDGLMMSEKAEMELDDGTYDACREEALTDAYGEYEQRGGWYEMINQHLSVPFETSILGIEAIVVKIDLNDDSHVVAVVTRGSSSMEVRLEDVALLAPLPTGVEWVLAYRRWIEERR